MSEELEELVVYPGRSAPAARPHLLHMHSTSPLLLKDYFDTMLKGVKNL